MLFLLGAILGFIASFLVTALSMASRARDGYVMIWRNGIEWVRRSELEDEWQRTARAVDDITLEAFQKLMRGES